MTRMSLTPRRRHVGAFWPFLIDHKLPPLIVREYDPCMRCVFCWLQIPRYRHFDF